MKRTICSEWLETFFVVCSVVGSVVFFSKTGRPFGTQMALIGSVLLLLVWRKEPLANVGLCWNASRQDMLDLIMACSVSGLVLFLGNSFFKNAGLGWLLPVAVPPDNKQVWILSQFLQVAFSEELFFRGYVQGRVKVLLEPVCSKKKTILALASIMISSGVFAIAHCVVWGHWAGTMTLFPGLVLGWLFWRTGSLLGPVLYHGLANIGYVMILSTKGQA